MEKEAKQGKLDELEAMDTSQDQGKKEKKIGTWKCFFPAFAGSYDKTDRPTNQRSDGHEGSEVN